MIKIEKFLHWKEKEVKKQRSGFFFGHFNQKKGKKKSETITTHWKALEAMSYNYGAQATTSKK